MSVDEVSRIRLAKKAVEIFGEAEAMTLMKHLPIGGIANLATKDDLALTRAELRADFGELRADFAELRADFGELRADFAERMNHQTITIIRTMTGIMGLIAAVMKWG